MSVWLVLQVMCCAVFLPQFISISKAKMTTCFKYHVFNFSAISVSQMIEYQFLFNIHHHHVLLEHHAINVPVVKFFLQRLLSDDTCITLYRTHI